MRTIAQFIIPVEPRTKKNSNRIVINRRTGKPMVIASKAYEDFEARARFHDYYEANGWKVGKNPMKDWKAAFRYWETHSGTGHMQQDRYKDKDGNNRENP